MAATYYVVDTNVYITAFTRYYHFDFKTKFWDILRRGAISGHIVSIDRVRDELTVKTDALSDWVKGLPEDAFGKTDRPDDVVWYAKL